MAQYKHAIVADGDGRKIVFPPFITQAEVDALGEFETRPDDVVVVAYPKSGTTWMNQIVHLLLNDGEQGDQVLSEAVPWIEGAPNRYGGLERLLVQLDGRRRAFHSHLPYNLMPGVKAGIGRYVYVARNPKDVAVSYYYHAVSKSGYEGQWEEFFPLFLSGQVGYGHVLDHVLDWRKASLKSDHILFMMYESMKRDLATAVREVARFIGVAADPALVEHVVARSSFRAMAGNPQANLNWVEQRPGVPGHMRKGIVGDWRTHFSPTQSADIDAQIASRIAGSGLQYDYGEAPAGSD